jgi:hypothetical protein
MTDSRVVVRAGSISTAPPADARAMLARIEVCSSASAATTWRSSGSTGDATTRSTKVSMMCSCCPIALSPTELDAPLSV